MRKLRFGKILCWILVLCLLAGCGAADRADSGAGVGVTVEDAEGNRVQVPENARVIACYGSFAECWMLSGGELVGVTVDAVEEHGLAIPDSVETVGTVKQVNLEKIVELEPDYVILSADLSAQLALKENLQQMGIPFGYFRVDTFADYQAMMRQFCAVNDGEERYQTYVTDVKARIDRILGKIPDGEGASVLLLRAYSTGMKAKAEDHLAGQILAEFGMKNLASETPSLLEELSLEKIVQEDPEYIFVSTMGNEEDALQYLKENVENNPAWSGLAAVKNGRYLLLPKELFHYKPNHRWDESYAYLAKIIYPGIFEETTE